LKTTNNLDSCGEPRRMPLWNPKGSVEHGNLTKAKSTIVAIVYYQQKSMENYRKPGKDDKRCVAPIAC
jgi:hypothetical protein